MLPTANAYSVCGVVGMGVGGGAGSFSYYPEPQKIGNRLTDIEVFNYPYNAGPQEQDSTLRIRLCDTNSTEPILHVTYELSIFPQNETQPIFHDIFHSHAGLLTLIFRNLSSQSSTGLLTNSAYRDSTLLNSWIASGPNGTVNITSPSLHQVGMYDINVKILGLDTDKISFNENNAPSFHYNLSIRDRHFVSISYKGQDYTILIEPIFGKVQSSSFDSSPPRLSWSLSSNGTLGTPQIFDNPMVFLHIPKSISPLSSFSLPLKITMNGIVLTNHAINIDPDPSSSDNYIVIITPKYAFQGNIPENKIPNYVNATYSFELSQVTQTTKKYDELPSRVVAWVSWSPNPPVPNGSATANIKFFTRDGLQLKNVIYDINMHPPTEQGYEGRTALVAKNGTDFQNYNFTQNGTYRMHLYVRGVSDSSFPNSVDTTLNGDADGYVFVVPEFPFALPILVIGIASMVVFYRVRLTK